MKLIFRCHPEHEGRLPPPRLARAGLPDWLRDSPARAYSEAAGAEVRTVKQCPPFVDAMSYGVLLPLAADLHVEKGRFTWASDLPLIAGDPARRSPIGVHAPEQAAGAPFAAPDQFTIKFMNYWSIEAPAGWSVWFGHPANRPDLPFHTLTGLVSADRFGLGLVHLPALWTDQAFEGVLKAGEPVAQCYAVPRVPVEIATEPLSAEALAEQEALRAALQAEPGAYRKRWR